MYKKVLVLGATGMLGHTLFQHLSANPGLSVSATARSTAGLNRWFGPDLAAGIHTGVDADNFDALVRVVGAERPDTVINCIGIIKQLPSASDPLTAIPVNALLPHRIARLCQAAGARMIHISTDCVFNGTKGLYSEDNPSDAEDLYGRSKFLGEVGYPHCVTLRTSIIGHELKGKHALVEWFLSQEGKVRGYSRAIYSGFPTIELSRVIEEIVLPRFDLQGLYHLSSEPITKYDLLKLIAERYGKKIDIEPYEGVSEDRSLDSSRFRAVTGYRPPPWRELIERMHGHYRSLSCYQ